MMLTLLWRCALPAASTTLAHANRPVTFACAETVRFAARQFSSNYGSPSETHSKSSIVWVGGLPYSATASDMMQHFGEFGTIKRIQMQANAIGSPKGSCLITFSSPAEAAAALAMDRHTIGSRWMAVKLHRQKNSVENAPVIKPSSTIWIGGLPFKTSDADIHERFGSFGSISNVRFTERYDGKPTGMCYVTYSAPEAAEAAAASMNKATFGSRYVHVKLHFDQGTIKPSRKADDQVKTIRQDQVNRVYFGNIPFTTTETELAETFASCGDLKDVLIYRDKNQRSRGHGYVQFKDAGSAAAAVRDLHGTIVGGREMSVEVPKAMRAAVAAVATSTTVRVTNLPVDLENDTLRSMFDHCGAISHLRRASDNQSALLVFDSPEGAQEAQGLAGADIEGRVIHVQLTEEKDE